MTGPRPFADRRDGRRHAALKEPGIRGVQGAYLRISVLPAIVVTVVCAAVTASVLAAHASPGALRAALVGITCGVLLLLAVAVIAANVGFRRLSDQIWAAQALTRRAQPDLEQLADQVLHGEQPVGLPPAPAGAADGHDDPLLSLVQDLAHFQYSAGQVILRVADWATGPSGHGRLDQRVEIFVNLARRMQIGRAHV